MDPRFFHMHVVGVAKISPGTVYTGPFTIWNSEEKLWWDLFGRCDDAYSVRVE